MSYDVEKYTKLRSLRVPHPMALAMAKDDNPLAQDFSPDLVGSSSPVFEVDLENATLSDYTPPGVWDEDEQALLSPTGSNWFGVAIRYDFDPEKNYTIRVVWESTDTSSLAIYSLPSTGTATGYWHSLRPNSFSPRNGGEPQEDWIVIGDGFTDPAAWAAAHEGGEHQAFLDVPGESATLGKTKIRSISVFEGDVRVVLRANGVPISSDGASVTVPGLSADDSGQSRPVRLMVQTYNNEYFSRWGPGGAAYIPASTVLRSAGTPLWNTTVPTWADFDASGDLRLDESGIYHLTGQISYTNNGDQSQRVLIARLVDSSGRTRYTTCTAEGTAASSTFGFEFANIFVNYPPMSLVLNLSWSPKGPVTASPNPSNVGFQIYRSHKLL